MSKFGFKGRFVTVCIDPITRKIKWIDDTNNIVVDEGLGDIMQKYFLNGTNPAAWYVGLKGTSETVLSTFTASGIGSQFSEFTSYTEANRPTWTIVRSSKTITNSASPAQFTISGLVVQPTNIYGAFIISNNTKAGTTGVLWCCANFTAPRPVSNDDIIKIVYTNTSQDV